MKINLFPLILTAILGGVAYLIGGPRAALITMGVFITIVTIYTLIHLKE